MAIVPWLGDEKRLVDVVFGKPEVAIVYVSVNQIFNSGTDISAVVDGIPIIYDEENLLVDYARLSSIFSIQAYGPSGLEHPPITQVVTGEMFGYYNYWDYSPYSHDTSTGTIETYVIDLDSFLTQIALIVGDDPSYVLSPTKYEATTTDLVFFLFQPYMPIPGSFEVSSQEDFNGIVQSLFGNGLTPVPGPDDPDPPDKREELFALFGNYMAYVSLETVERVMFDRRNIVFLNLRKIRGDLYKQSYTTWQNAGSIGDPPEKPVDFSFKVLVSVDSSQIVVQTYRYQKDFSVDSTNYPIWELNPDKAPEDVLKDSKSRTNYTYIEVTINFDSLEITISDPTGGPG